MTTPAAPTSSSRSTAAEGGGRGHIGLVVLGSIASGLVLGLVLVLAVFAGGVESEITSEMDPSARPEMFHPQLST